MPKKIDLHATKTVSGSRYPSPYHEPCSKRTRHALGDAAGLTSFGVNLSRLAPGTWSSQRHWHSAEDEFIYVIEGEVILVTDSGEETLRAGDCAAFRSGDPDGHHLVNKSGQPARVLEVGTTNSQDRCTYPDIDMIADYRGYSHRDGTPYPPTK